VELEVGAAAAAEVAARTVLPAAVSPVDAALTLVGLHEATLTLPLVLAAVVVAAALAPALVFAGLLAQLVTDQTAPDAAKGATSEHSARTAAAAAVTRPAAVTRATAVTRAAAVTCWPRPVAWARRVARSGVLRADHGAAPTGTHDQQPGDGAHDEQQQ